MPAAADTVSRDIKVSFAELNLQKEAGVRVLYTRLLKASKTACGAHGPQTLLPTAPALRDHRTCVKESLSNAVSQIGNARLTAIHQSS